MLEDTSVYDTSYLGSKQKGFRTIVLKWKDGKSLQGEFKDKSTIEFWEHHRVVMDVLHHFMDRYKDNIEYISVGKEA